jgi:hypothetical protein
LVYSPDNWDFPNGQISNLNWIGQVHRGTPWQTIYLKSSAVALSLWENWAGDTNDEDAQLTSPTNDWHLASLLVSLLNTNDFRSLLSVNNPDTNAWLALFDGLMAWTNSSPDIQISTNYEFGTIPSYDAVTISSNSIPAGALVGAIQSARINQPNQFFRDVGDILAAPELTEQSPFLNWNDSAQQEYGISDEAYEKIPGQLLPRLRADAVGSAASSNHQLTVQFTGYDGHAYAIEVSSNLVDWERVSTNYPANGAFNFTNAAVINASQFYRSILLQ